MTYSTDIHESVLSPHETEICLEAFLVDSTHTLFTNSDGLYVTGFTAYSSTDDQRLSEHLESCKRLVEQRSGYYSNKDVRCNVETDESRCSFVATQTFAPKVDPMPPNRVFEDRQHVSLRCYVNDDPSGELYLNISYLDVYDQSNGIQDDSDYGAIPDASDFEW